MGNLLSLVPTKYTEYTVVNSMEEVEQFRESVQNVDVIAIDIESSGLDVYLESILLIQISLFFKNPEDKNSRISKCFIFRTNTDFLYIVLPILKTILENNNILKLGHNLSFDYKFIFHNYGIRIRNTWDTMLAESVLIMGKLLRVNLKEVVDRRFSIKLDKEIRNAFVGRKTTSNFTEEEYLYSAIDVNILYDLYLQQKEEVEKLKLNHVITIENKVLPVTSMMEYWGLLIDLEKWNQYIEDEEIGLLETLKDIMEIAEWKNPVQMGFLDDRRFQIDNLANSMSLNSPKELVKFFKRRGINIENTDKQTLRSFKSNKLVKKITEFRESYKLLSTFLYSMRDKINPISGRLHPGFLQLPLIDNEHSGGATTGRYASRNPNCFTDDTEILTEKGWKLFSDLVEGEDKVAQWHIGGRIDFVIPTKYHAFRINPKTIFSRVVKNGKFEIEPSVENSKIVRITGDGFDLKVSHNHRILVANRWGQLSRWTAGEYLKQYNLFKDKDWWMGELERNHYFMGLSGRKRIRNLKVTEENYDGIIYCVSVPSEKIIVRTNGKICVMWNCQNIPAKKAVRECFIARKGYKIITADYNGCEVRIVANLSKDKNLIDFYNKEGGDLHGYVASKMFNLPVDKCSKSVDKDGNEIDAFYSKERKVAKFVVFGTFYGQGAMGLSNLMDIPLDDADRFIKEFKKSFPQLSECLDDFGRKAVSSRTIRTTTGRIKFFDVSNELQPSELNRIRRQGMNFVIQGGNADITKYALARLFNEFYDDDVRILLTVHDEIVMEVPENNAEYYEREMKRIMTECGNYLVRGEVSFEVNAKIGDSWTK